MSNGAWVVQPDTRHQLSEWALLEIVLCQRRQASVDRSTTIRTKRCSWSATNFNVVVSIEAFRRSDWTASDGGDPLPRGLRLCLWQAVCLGPECTSYSARTSDA